MEPAVGQLWIGRNYHSLLKVVKVDSDVAYVKLLATGNHWISDRVGKTNCVLVEHLQAYAVYPGDLL